MRETIFSNLWWVSHSKHSGEILNYQQTFSYLYQMLTSKGSVVNSWNHIEMYTATWFSSRKSGWTQQGRKITAPLNKEQFLTLLFVGEVVVHFVRYTKAKISQGKVYFAFLMWAQTRAIHIKLSDQGTKSFLLTPRRSVANVDYIKLYSLIILTFKRRKKWAISSCRWTENNDRISL